MKTVHLIMCNSVTAHKKFNVTKVLQNWRACVHSCETNGRSYFGLLCGHHMASIVRKDDVVVDKTYCFNLDHLLPFCILPWTLDYALGDLTP